MTSQQHESRPWIETNGELLSVILGAAAFGFALAFMCIGIVVAS
ncbi:hypothetical protein [Microbacterium dauci]|uniref:Uncharacterized protein n=1 Tax=Microbacterium dauci TaxID=3048008 RepID=A0ABT6ZHB6_9MICO|nr:hypothetical protein [Microbacterium sp. LX3-4]MDJ1115333.1 hypothetical protein [Microbacterium sp. LX3-4]